MMSKHNYNFRTWQKQFYKSKEWQRLRDYIRYERDLGTCQKCKKIIINKKWIVDHIEEINEENKNNPNITLNQNNLQLLCITCHNKKTFMSNRQLLEKPPEDRDPFEKFKNNNK